MAKRMKKTWHIGERCRFGTLKIVKATEGSITLGLCHYRTSNTVVEETFTEHFEMMSWLEDQIDYYHATQIAEELERNGFKLKESCAW